VLAGIHPVLCIVHDSGTGGWTFLPQNTQPGDLVGVTLGEMFEFLKADVLEEAISLPLHWRAKRKSVNDPWIRDCFEGRPSQKRRGSGR
jgi:hypothetical protein